MNRNKKYFGFFLMVSALLAVFLLGSSGGVQAAGECNCTLKVSGVNCDIPSVVYKSPVSSEVLAGADLISKAVFQGNCSLISKIKPDKKIFTIGPTCADSTNLNGLEGYTATIACEVAPEPSPVNVKPTAAKKTTSPNSDSKIYTAQEAESARQAIEMEASANAGFNALGTTNVSIVVGRAIKAVMGIVGSIALAMFVYSGLMWMTAAGNSEKEDKSKMMLVWSAFGVVAIFGSYALL
ncbi:MAG: hypothetical protein AAB390_02455, partial [Patescibacteria group bacterium]